MHLHKYVLEKIEPVKEKTKSSSKYRTSENSYSDEFHRLVEDEVAGIVETKKGYCFNEEQLKAIIIGLKNKLTNEEFTTLKWEKEDEYFNISFKRTRKKK